MAEKTHIVYFIGGPEDQAKRVMPGEKPDRSWMVTADIAAPPYALEPGALRHMECVRHEYRLFPVPNLSLSSQPRVFTAVYRGLLL